MILKKYFESWSGYNIPFKPQKEISEEEAKCLRAYYTGVYKDDLLVSLEKILDNKREWIDFYEYRLDKGQALYERRMHKSDGSIITQKFDKNGKIIIEK